jgi:uncharacterized protein with PQ loop repeat
MGNALGIDGYVVFNINVAHYYCLQEPNNMVFITLINLAGGLGSGLVFFSMYLIFNIKNKETGNYQMEMFTFLAISIWQIVYGLTELSNLGITNGNLVGLGCGLGFTFIYLTFLKKMDVLA